MMEHYLTWGGEGGLTTNPIRFGSYEGLEQREKGRKITQLDRRMFIVTSEDT